VTAPGDVSANYLALMQQRGWTWDDLADQFDRDAAEGRALDGGRNARNMAAWARSNADAGRERREAAEDPQRRDPRPDVASPTPGKRAAVPPPAPSRRSTGSTASGRRATRKRTGARAGAAPADPVDAAAVPAAPVVTVAEPGTAAPVPAVDVVAATDGTQG